MKKCKIKDFQYGEENYTNLALFLGEDKISETSFYNEN